MTSETAMSGKTGENELTLWTVGHSTRAINEFISLLTAHKIKTLVDVRRFPGSRKYPWFNQDALRDALSGVGIAYVAMPELGGRRRPRRDSRNDAWRNESFRGYADYMETAAFQEGIERLRTLAQRKRTAVMCSEAVWWRCHRGLIADVLKSTGVRVEHILSESKTEAHPYTSAARIEDGKLSYSKEGESTMPEHFKIGDHVTWNSEAGWVSGHIIKIHTSDTEYKGHPRHASEEEPQYEIKSDKTDHIAMHKGKALRKMGG